MRYQTIQETALALPPLHPNLYLASLSCRTFGSSVLWRPSKVLLIASLAPIIGFSTAIGTARTTERTGP